MKSLKTIKGGELASLLSSNFSAIVNENKNYEVTYKSPIDLIDHRRLDLLAKYIYAKGRSNNVKSTFSKVLYLEHIKAFNHYVEADGSNKIGEKSFLDSMDKLMDSLELKGFDDSRIVPLSGDGVLLDGAHRVGLSLCLNLDIPTVSLNAETPIFNYDYFRSRGLPEIMLDTLALEYAKLKQQTRLVILWPTADGRQDEVEAVLNEYGDIVHFKELSLTKIGAHNLVSLAYKNEPWVGSLSDGYAGATNKANWCFSKSGPLRVFAFESTADLVKMKEEIREIFNVDKHSIHINDTYQETLELAATLFNNNSVNFLNTRVVRDFKKFEYLFKEFTDWFATNNNRVDDFCLDGSATLAAFGVRDVNDLDVITINPKLPEIAIDIDVSDCKRKFHSLMVSELVCDPRNYFTHRGVKFISLSVLKKFKENRSSPTDLEDLKLIDNLMNSLPLTLPLSIRLQKWLTIKYLLGRVKLILLKLRYHFLSAKKRV